MNRIIIWTCIVLGCFSAIQAQTWDRTMYASYTYKTFQKAAMAQQSIDFNAIDQALLNAAVFYATNVQREKYRRKLFIYDVRLEHAAQKHSQDMVEKDFFSHSSKVSGKRVLSDRLKLEGIDYQMCAENIAIEFAIQLESGRSVFSPSQNGGYFSYQYKGEPIPTHTYWSFAQSLVDGWMNSPGHRKNILDERLTHLGCGNAFFLEGKGEDALPEFKSTQNFCAFFD